LIFSVIAASSIFLKVLGFVWIIPLYSLAKLAAGFSLLKSIQFEGRMMQEFIEMGRFMTGSTWEYCGQEESRI
jgi:hypothetical protein